MVYIHVVQQVEDYARWREGFDNHASAREAAGSTDEVFVMRNVDDPNEVTVILGWSDPQRARAFAQSVSLREAMQNAGAIGRPEISFLQSAG
jgi:heme-degrading monooxygenase HmoA